MGFSNRFKINFDLDPVTELNNVAFLLIVLLLTSRQSGDQWAGLDSDAKTSSFHVPNCHAKSLGKSGDQDSSPHSGCSYRCCQMGTPTNNKEYGLHIVWLTFSVVVRWQVTWRLIVVWTCHPVDGRNITTHQITWPFGHERYYVSFGMTVTMPLFKRTTRGRF